MKTKSIEEFVNQEISKHDEQCPSLCNPPCLETAMKELLAHLEKETISVVTACKSPDMQYAPDKLHEAKTIYRIDAVDAVRSLLHIPSREEEARHMTHSEAKEELFKKNPEIKKAYDESETSNW